MTTSGVARLLIAWKEIKVKRDIPFHQQTGFQQNPQAGGCSGPRAAMLPLPLMDKFNVAYTIIRKSSPVYGLVKLRPYFDDR